MYNWLDYYTTRGLFSTEKFFARSAILIIEYMIRTGRIAETNFQLYCREW